MTKTIKVGDDVHRRLKNFKRHLQVARGEDFTLGEAIDEALKAAAYASKHGLKYGYVYEE